MLSHKKREGKISKLNLRKMPDNFRHFAIKNESFGLARWTRFFKVSNLIPPNASA